MAARRHEPSELDALLDGRRIPLRHIRLAAWGSASAVAVALAVTALVSEQGSQRLAKLSAPAAARPDKIALRVNDTELEIRRMSEALRTLTIDRDRLKSRISMLERGLDEVSVTGSIPPNPGRELQAAGMPASGGGPGAAPAVPVQPGPSVTAAEPETQTRAREPEPLTEKPPPAATNKKEPLALSGTADRNALPSKSRAAAQQTADSAPAPAKVPAASSGSEIVVTKTEFGIDLGGDQTIEGLRNIWTTLRGSHAALFQGLRPIVAIRDGQKPGTMDLRLVAGPLADAGVAARYCAALAVSGVNCQPAVFDGQRLALR